MFASVVSNVFFCNPLQRDLCVNDMFYYKISCYPIFLLIGYVDDEFKS